VFGIRISDANKAIAKAGHFPPNFEIDDPNDAVSAKGTFEAWKLTLGGSGGLINLNLPVPSVDVTLPDSSVKTITGVTVPITVRLKYIPSSDPVASGTDNNLMIWDGAPASEQAVTIGNIRYGNNDPDFMTKAAFRTLIGAWLNRSLGDFAHVFATVNLDRVAAKEYAWLQPTDTAYAYVDLEGQDDGVLAVLSMTEGRSSSGLLRQASANLVGPNQTSGFLISGPRIVEKFLLPGLYQVFKGTKKSDYQVSPDGLSITNVNQDIKFTGKDPKTGDEYTAYIETLQLMLDGTEVKLECVTRSHVSPGVEAYCHSINAMTLSLADKTSDPTVQTFKFHPAHDPVTNHWLVKDPAIDITEKILSIVAIVLIVIAAVLTDGAALLIVAAIVGAVAGAILVAEGIIGLVASGDGPAITDMVLNATAPVKWKDAKDFKVTWAGLNGSLQLIGNPNFAFAN
jgi:hypothetical protein